MTVNLNFEFRINVPIGRICGMRRVAWFMLMRIRRVDHFVNKLPLRLWYLAGSVCGSWSVWNSAFVYVYKRFRCCWFFFLFSWLLQRPTSGEICVCVCVCVCVAMHNYSRKTSHLCVKVVRLNSRCVCVCVYVYTRARVCILFCLSASVCLNVWICMYENNPAHKPHWIN